MSARNIVAKPVRSSDVNAPAAGIAGPGEQQHAQHQQDDTVERDVSLAEAFLEEIDVGMKRRRVNHQEPEESAETHNERGRIERQLDPGHAYGGGADQQQRRGRHGRIESTEEDVRGTGEGVVAQQPGNDGDVHADEIQRRVRSSARSTRCAAVPRPYGVPPPRQ